MRSLLTPDNGARGDASTFCKIHLGSGSGVRGNDLKKAKMRDMKQDPRLLCEQGRRKPVASQA